MQTIQKADGQDVTEAYIRETKIDGDQAWVLFDDEGNAVACSFDRSNLFFFAADYQIQLVTVH